MNQHNSRRRALLWCLNTARALLSAGNLYDARCTLAYFRREFARVPASTRRRWRCGR